MPRSCYALAILFALSSQAPAQTFVAATNATVRSETLESPTVPPSHSIFIINNSTVPITVFGYTLSECENVKVRCDTRRTSFRVPPRARRMLVRVEPRSQDLGFYYRFNFSWHAASPAAKTVLGAMADAGDASAAARLAAIRRADSERVADVGYTELTVDAWAALSDEQLSMHAQPE